MQYLKQNMHVYRDEHSAAWSIIHLWNILQPNFLNHSDQRLEEHCFYYIFAIKRFNHGNISKY